MNLESWGDLAKDSPGKLLIKAGLSLTVIVVILSIAGSTLGWFSEAGEVARNELGPKALLKKYEWFKDASAQLGKKTADIQVYQTRLNNLKADYKGVSRKDWDRTDKDQMNLWNQEVAGVTASFNGLAAEYNAQMAKVNWAFCNVGSLPEGAIGVLPREYIAK